MTFKTVAIISALDEEAAHIADSLDDVTAVDGASLNVLRGTVKAHSGRTVDVAVTVGGMGLVNAAATTQYLIDLVHPDAVIFSGIAGSLNPELHINDIVLGGTLRYLDTDMRLVGQWKPGTEEFHSDPALIEMAEDAMDEMGIKHIVGTIASGNYFVDGEEKVAEVINTTHADAVEMEGAAVVHVAARNDVPALVIRAMSDNADTDYEEFKDFDVSEYADTAARLAVNILERM
ncbi:5'-methylthioadenosine/S-adenosylhomocysteine nucleosidase [Bifidobacterium choloepi]|uniref:adenosylhomocysteine nucleosidase n=1 Tax=Bifidobacterium choloepi TaxID=2614131 RepID=A0A6I5N0N3_9BIFI|nr:5'-methylthioadenosine/S-adenosylhomocysteine nucleosidase [Bifidobacterium choloepi]NEG69695.1 5'-methylthioadenosine/S-adenosylhomocysteine nucleosidase [Bifidobacterium choloepi]